MADTFRYRDDAPHEEPAITLDSFIEQPGGASAVRVEAGDDVRLLIPYLDQLQLIEVSFPRFRDGRGFSSARILREAGYKGELRAEGDVLVDLVFFMRRCGFDSFAPQVPLNPVDVEASLHRYGNVYQDATDAAVPIWKLRHG
jgi:uncharacterized protein (DUF934 family)